MSQADWAIWLYDNKMFLVEFQFNFQPNWYNNLQSSSLIPQKIYGMKMHIFQKPTCQLLILNVWFITFGPLVKVFMKINKDDSWLWSNWPKKQKTKNVMNRTKGNMSQVQPLMSSTWDPESGSYLKRPTLRTPKVFHSFLLRTYTLFIFKKYIL